MRKGDIDAPVGWLVEVEDDEGNFSVKRYGL